MERVQTFVIGDSLTLMLEDIHSRVVLESVDRPDVQVSLEGDEELLKDLLIEQISPGELLIRENSSGGASVSIDGNSITITGSVHGSMSVIGGRVIINGREVTDTSDGVHVTKDPVKITVSVPLGCSLDIASCSNLYAAGPYGFCKVRADGQGQIIVHEATSVSLRSSDQVQVEIKRVTDGSKPARLESSGQSHVWVAGNFGDVEATSSGQSSITIDGDCASFEGNTSGQSRIVRRGTVNGSVRERSSGQSRITAK